jgi:hypothetical protein
MYQQLETQICLELLPHLPIKAQAPSLIVVVITVGCYSSGGGGGDRMHSLFICK